MGGHFLYFSTTLVLSKVCDMVMIHVGLLQVKFCFVIWKDVTLCGFHGDLSKLTRHLLTRYLNLIDFLIMTIVEK